MRKINCSESRRICLEFAERKNARKNTGRPSAIVCGRALSHSGESSVSLVTVCLRATYSKYVSLRLFKLRSSKRAIEILAEELKFNAPADCDGILFSWLLCSVSSVKLLYGSSGAFSLVSWEKLYYSRIVENNLYRSQATEISYGVYILFISFFSGERLV